MGAIHTDAAVRIDFGVTFLYIPWILNLKLLSIHALKFSLIYSSDCHQESQQGGSHQGVSLQVPSERDSGPAGTVPSQHRPGVSDHRDREENLHYA